MGSTHTPSNLHAIPLVVLNHLLELTLRKRSLCSYGVDKIYPDHTNSLCKAVLAPHIFPNTGELRKIQDENINIENV